MPHFMILSIPYINLLNLSWIKKKSVFEEYGAFNDVDIKVSPKEMICMNCQILFSRKNIKNISKCCLLKFLPSMLSIKMHRSTSARASLLETDAAH